MAAEGRRSDPVHRTGKPLGEWLQRELNGKLRDELLNGETFTTLHEAKVLIERWRQHYNTVRPHSSLGYKPPAPEAILPRPAGLTYATLRSAQQGDHNRRTLT